MSDRIINFTNTYEAGDYEGFTFIDCSDIPGTDMYCDEPAYEEIRQRLLAGYRYGSGSGQEDARTEAVKSQAAVSQGIHLIDSGNYHYMSRLFTSFIDEPYELVFFDNHTDMKPAMFDMLSCGSWAKEVLEKDGNLRRLYMIGPPEKSVEELPGELLENGKLVFITREEFSKERVCEAVCEENSSGKKEISRLPIYISVDKDVLAGSEVKTNWDQGSMRMGQLLSALDLICSGRRVAGADICGLFPRSAGESEFFLSREQGMKSDKAIIEVLRKYV
ncbi:MAG: arginase family protein [Lachnospiraceae bacterium]|nr:arginase family protein [Lachnospiraceae bacterium]